MILQSVFMIVFLSMVKNLHPDFVCWSQVTLRGEANWSQSTPCRSRAIEVSPNGSGYSSCNGLQSGKTRLVQCINCVLNGLQGIYITYTLHGINHQEDTKSPSHHFCGKIVAGSSRRAGSLARRTTAVAARKCGAAQVPRQLQWTVSVIEDGA